MREKIKLVVFNEHTLGYILPELPDFVQILHSSILKGAVFSVQQSNFLIGKNDKVRLASKQDFADYRISFEGYEKDSIYLFNEK
jgi:hypothetical protein